MVTLSFMIILKKIKNSFYIRLHNAYYLFFFNSVYWKWEIYLCRYGHTQYSNVTDQHLYGFANQNNILAYYLYQFYSFRRQV